MDYTSVPLSPTLWFDSLRRLKSSLEEGTGIEVSLRRAYHLAQLAPGPLSDLVSLECSEERFEFLLATGDFLKAAKELTASQQIHFETRVPNGHAVAKMTSQVFDAQGSAVHEDQSVALLSAWLQLFLSIHEAAQEEIIRARDPALRKPMSGQHQRSTPH